MSKYVLWKFLSVKLVQVAVTAAAVWLLWFSTSLILNSILGDLVNSDGDMFTMEYSQTLALVLVAFAAVIVYVVWLIRLTLLRINARLNLWTLSR